MARFLLFLTDCDSNPLRFSKTLETHSDTAERVRRALNERGFHLAPREPRFWVRAPHAVMRALGGSALRGFIPQRPAHFAAPASRWSASERPLAAWERRAHHPRGRAPRGGPHHDAECRCLGAARASSSLRRDASACTLRRASRDQRRDRDERGHLVRGVRSHRAAGALRPGRERAVVQVGGGARDVAQTGHHEEPTLDRDARDCSHPSGAGSPSRARRVRRSGGLWHSKQRTSSDRKSASPRVSDAVSAASSPAAHRS